MKILADLVRCNWCEWKGFVNRCTDTCPKCKKEGFLMDIEQDVEVEKSKIKGVQ